MNNKPLLIDLDGVLRIGNSLANRVGDFLSFIEDNKIQACILSNSSLYNSNEIDIFFNQHNLEIKVPIITAIDAVYKYVCTKYKKVFVYCDDNVKPMLNQILDYQNPAAILIGDIWNYKILQ